MPSPPTGVVFVNAVAEAVVQKEVVLFVIWLLAIGGYTATVVLVLVAHELVLAILLYQVVTETILVGKV